MSYAGLTIKDSNVIKRYLHRNRYRQALTGLRNYPPSFSGNILDFGGGNGELCKYIYGKFPNAKIVLYELTPSIRAEAIDNLKEYPEIEIVGDVKDIPLPEFDIIFCLEVFEHIIEEQYSLLFNEFIKLMSDESLLIIGVPVEVFLPALLKGIFRMCRRYGAYDANIRNVLKCMIGKPPQKRIRGTIENSLPYYYEHLGFDYRVFQYELSKYFNIVKSYGGPIAFLTPSLNFEKYYMCKKSDDCNIR